MKQRIGFSATMAILLTTAVAAEPVRVVSSESLVAARAAQFRTDDQLLSARFGDGEPVVLASAFDFRLLAASRMLQQPMQLRVRRGDAEIDLTLADGVELLTVASSTAPDSLQGLDDALLAAHARKDWAEADRLLPLALDKADADGRRGARALVALHGAAAAWFEHDYAKCRARITDGISSVRGTLFEIPLTERDELCSGFLGTWQDSQKFLTAIMPLLEQQVPDTLAHARLASALAQIESFSVPEQALTRIEGAVRAARARCGDCRDYGLVVHRYGDVLAAMNRHVAVRDAYEEGVRIARAVEPGGYALAARLRMLARTNRLLGQHDLAQQQLHEAIDLLRASNTPEIEFSAFYNGLGAVAIERGDFIGASAEFRRALQVLAQGGAEVVDSANARHNLGWTLAKAGDFAAAEREMREALRIISKHNQGIYLATFANGLAEVELARGNDAAAEPILNQMRDIHLRANAQSQELGDTWLKLAQLYARNGRDAEAKAAWTRAFAIFEKLPADSFVLASPVTEQALSELAQGHLEIAAAGFERALRLYSTQAHDSLAMSRAAHGAGIVALRQQQIDRARSLIDQALKIRRRDVPGSAEHAETLHASGQVAALAGDLANAERLYCEASALLDDASLKVGGDEFGEARFRAQFAEIYRDCLALKARRGAPDQALEVLERSRARGFRHALEQRRLQLADAPQRAALDALAINVEGEAQARAHAVDPALHESLREIGRATAARLRSERHALEQQLRARLPALAAQDLAGLRRRLRADEAYLAFSVGDNETIALLLRGDRPVQTQRIAWTRAQLREQVQAMRQQLAAAQRNADWRRPASELQQRLIAPFATSIDGAKVLLISPDGPLHDLPFAALWDATASRHLIETHALALLDSLSARPPPSSTTAAATTRVLAVADPTAAATVGPALAQVLRSSGSQRSALPALPAARREIEALATRYPQQTETLVGERATEANVRARAGSAQILHFAVHALLDRERPLESALVLHPGKTAADDDDGLLQLFEVLEDLRLKANLVVLSACDTALGKELAGEGLLGFARAFALVGTRTTVASLWSVEDESTADLMTHFYAARDQGLAPTLALRSAMLAMLKRNDARAITDTTRAVGGLAPRSEVAGNVRHPYYWAAFQVYGD